MFPKSPLPAYGIKSGVILRMGSFKLPETLCKALKCRDLDNYVWDGDLTRDDCSAHNPSHWF